MNKKIQLTPVLVPMGKEGMRAERQDKFMDEGKELARLGLIPE